MKTLSLKIDIGIFNEVEQIVSILKKPRNRYINEAIKHYNNHQMRKIMELKLKKESELTSSESMKVLSEFEKIEYIDQAK